MTQVFPFADNRTLRIYRQFERGIYGTMKRRLTGCPSIVQSSLCQGHHLGAGYQPCPPTKAALLAARLLN